jgi:hypothetical protein
MDEAPILDRQFESSVPGLYLPAATRPGWRLFNPLLNITMDRTEVPLISDIWEYKYANSDRLADPKKQSIIPLPR